MNLKRKLQHSDNPYIKLWLKLESHDWYYQYSDDARAREKGKKEGEDIYIDAVFTTKGFVLKAPKIKVKDRPARVKVTILSKVKQP